MPSEWRYRRAVHAILAFIEGAPTIVQVIASIATAAAGIVASLPNDDWSKTRWIALAVFSVIALVCLVTGPILQWRAERSRIAVEADAKKKSIRLQREIEELEAANRAREIGHTGDLHQLRQHLCAVSENLLAHLELDNSSSRISVYQHEERHGEFLEAGRVSPNPEWRASGRGRYPDTMGLIADAWRNGDSHNRNARKTPEKWARLQASNHGIPYEVALGIAMKSQCILGVRITYDGRDVGVLMAESMDKDAIDSDAGEVVRAHPAYAVLGAMLAVGPKLPPEPEASVDAVATRPANVG